MYFEGRPRNNGDEGEATADFLPEAGAPAPASSSAGSAHAHVALYGIYEILEGDWPSRASRGDARQSPSPHVELSRHASRLDCAPGRRRIARGGRRLGLERGDRQALFQAPSGEGHRPDRRDQDASRRGGHAGRSPLRVVGLFRVGLGRGGRVVHRCADQGPGPRDRNVDRGQRRSGAPVAAFRRRRSLSHNGGKPHRADRSAAAAHRAGPRANDRGAAQARKDDRACRSRGTDRRWERQHRWNHRGEPGHPRGARETQDGRAKSIAGSPAGRIRDGQGAFCARAASAVHAQGSTLHHAELRNAVRIAARVRAVRPREGGLHRRRQHAQGALRARGRRNAVPG